MCLLAICVCLLWRNVCLGLLSIFDWVICFSGKAFTFDQVMVDEKNEIPYCIFMAKFAKCEVLFSKFLGTMVKSIILY